MAAQLLIRRLSARIVIRARKRRAMRTLKSVFADAVVAALRVDALGTVLASECGAGIQFTLKKKI